MEASTPAPDPVGSSNKKVFIGLGVLILVIVAVVAIVLLTRESEEEKALTAVCDARQDIQENVQEIAGLSVTNFTLNGFRESVEDIRADVKTIQENRAKLNPDRKQEVEQANQAFQTAFTDTIQGLGTDISIDNAKSKLSQAGSDLVAAYQSAYGPVDCSGVDTSD